MKFEQQLLAYLFQACQCFKGFMADLFVILGDNFFCIYPSVLPCVVVTVT